MGAHGRTAIGLACALTLSAPALAAPRVGQPAPDFTVTTFGGKTVSLADLKGDVVVLNFWATWCGPCRRELPILESHFRQAAPYGVQVLAVATQDGLSEPELRKIWGAAKLTIPAVHHIKGPYRPMDALPTSYVIDRHGVLVYAKAAAFDFDRLNALLTPLMREPIPRDAASPDASSPPPPPAAPAPPG